MNLFTQQFGLIDDCLRACVFADYIARQKPPVNSAWPAFADVCYADAVLTWSQVFGQYSQETHWKKLVDQIVIPDNDLLKPFNKTMIVQYLEITEKEWDNFHKLMLSTRNTRIAHLNTSCLVDELPNLAKVMHSAYLYREWLTEALHLGNRLGYKINISEDRARDAVLKYTELIARAYEGS